MFVFLALVRKRTSRLWFRMLWLRSNRFMRRAVFSTVFFFNEGRMAAGAVRSMNLLKRICGRRRKFLHKLHPTCTRRRPQESPARLCSRRWSCLRRFHRPSAKTWIRSTGSAKDTARHSTYASYGNLVLQLRGTCRLWPGVLRRANTPCPCFRVLPMKSRQTAPSACM